MEFKSADVVAVLAPFNPWWRGEADEGLAPWRRAAFADLARWAVDPPAPRAVLLTGARQVGKTTLLRQLADELLARGVAAENILYATFDHPLLKLAGLERVLAAWRELVPEKAGPSYLLLDEIHVIADWQTWLKHQVDFQKNRRIFATGSATPLVDDRQESGVGRWHTVKLATLSFYEYLRIRNTPEPALPELRSLQALNRWPERQFIEVGITAAALVPHFHEYLLRGGFPQTARVDTIAEAQKLLREDIVDKVLKRDMTALFNVRRIVQLEHVFLYLCLHDGGELNVQNLVQNLDGVKRDTAERFIELLVSAHLIHKLRPLGYGKEILRGRYKVYFGDAAIAPAVLLKGRAMLEQSVDLSRAVETAVFQHLVTRYYTRGYAFHYWRGPRDVEVDFVAQSEGRSVAFEVKYRHDRTQWSDLGGLSALLRARAEVERAYVVTRAAADFGPLAHDDAPRAAAAIRIPAALFCYWLGKLEATAAESARQVDEMLGET